MLGRRIDVPIVILPRRIVGAFRPALGLGVLVEKRVALDRGHPRLEIRPRLERVECLEPTLERVLHQAFRPALGLGVLVEKRVALDRGHPRLEIRPRLERVECLEPTLERVLHQVLRVFGVVGEFHRLPVQRIHRGHRQLLEAGPLLFPGFGFAVLFAHAAHSTAPPRDPPAASRRAWSAAGHFIATR